MSGGIHTVEIEGFGPVTFRALRRLEMKRLRERARHGPLADESPETTTALESMPPKEARRLREDALLFSYVTVPKLVDQELADAQARRPNLIEDIADAIRAKSWPN